MEKEKPIIVEETYKTSIENVWRALTELAQMKQWYFENIPEFRPEIGFTTKFNVITGGRVFPHLWEITNVITGKLLQYSWKYEGYKGAAIVTFELFKNDNFTELKMIYEIVNKFQDDIPEFKRESGEAGWNYFLHDSLKKFLLKNE